MAIITDINAKRKHRQPRGMPMCLSAADAAHELTLSQAKVYDMPRRKQLPGVRAGSRWLVPRPAFEQTDGTQY